MKRSMIRAAIVLLIVLAWAGAAHAQAGFRSVEGGRERVIAWLAEVPLPPGHAWSDPEIRDDEILVHLRRDGRTVGDVRASDRRMRMEGRESPSFHVFAAAQEPGQALARALVQAGEAFLAHDDGTFGAASKLRDAPPRGPDPTWYLAALCAAAGTLAGVLSARRREVTFGYALKPTHAIPVAVQATVFAYWALYCPTVLDRLREVPYHLALAYLLDAILAIAVRRRWELSFGPFPIVLSANLFAWFDPRSMVAVLVLAFASKAFLLRGGKHVFNPSTFGMTIVGLVAMTFPGVIGMGGLFHLLNLPPNMSEVVLIASLLPLSRVPIALVPIGAVAMITLERRLGINAPDITRGQIMIALLLLSTDPATIPRRPLGRLLYGAFYGALIGPFATLFHALHMPDDLAKVVPIPFGNLLAPWLDGLSGRPALASVERWLQPRANPAHVAVWLVVAAPMLMKTKAFRFEAERHWTADTPGLVVGPDHVPTCDENPLFCRGFTFADELRAWQARSRPP